MHVGVQAVLFTDMREERARSRAQGEWQSEMAKRNGQAKWQANGKAKWQKRK
jgi:hypothetical protein